MPKWILGLLIVVTTFALLASIAVLRVRSAQPQTDLDTTTSANGTIIAAAPGTNAAQVGARDASGKRVLIPRPGLEGYSIPGFSLVNQDGDPVDESVLEGEITVVAFVFTNCQLACPAITANMKIVYSQLEDTPVRFLSISVDPEHDTPEVLRAYADRMSIDTSRWPFLTGEDGEATRVVEESMQFEISDDPDDANIITLDDGSTMRNIRHPIKLFLVGPDRQILDFCAPTLRAERERFTALARKAAE
ncbi:MAG: SCO family protein [Planctomycetota bacterium]|nr:MAG: SCO family protein [Planctomycetota bacterium]